MGLNVHVYESKALDEIFLFLAVLVNILQLSWRDREMNSENVKILSLFISQWVENITWKEIAVTLEADCQAVFRPVIFSSMKPGYLILLSW